MAVEAARHLAAQFKLPGLPLDVEMAIQSRVFQEQSRQFIDPVEVAILRVDALAMVDSGYEFFRSANGVWLTDAVPPAFIASA